ncbi:MAG: hypothetical protein GVY13_07940 [Alphaproteobacteria bacterium]|jgi:ribosomal protein L16 Arg81 hydroxylase|nr:hypothetical protein [Alphaproteobacteria bacterium]
MPHSSAAFRHVVAPIASDTFLAEYWERQILLIRRQAPGYYGDLLTLEDIDRVITTLCLDNREINMVDARQELKPHDYSYPSGMIDPARLFQLFADGATVILPQLQLRVPTLAALCRGMEADLSHRFQTNIYMTPAGGAQGFRPHYDSHDVFVLQVAGSKAWKIYDTPVELPSRAQEFDPAGYTVGPPTQEFVLEAGDMLYIPRGVVHDAVSTDAISLHITLGAMVKTWGDLLVEALSEATLADPAFRRGLPPGFARPDFDRNAAGPVVADLLRRLAERSDPAALLDRFADDIVSTRHCLLPGQLRQVGGLADLDETTEVGPRPDLLYRILETGDTIALNCYGNDITFPPHVLEPLRFALTTDHYAIGDLPGDLDADGKIVLIRRLVREGLLMWRNISTK